VEVEGEVVIYARTWMWSATCSEIHLRVGYHILPYFLRDWIATSTCAGVLAHSTTCAFGVMANGVEKPTSRLRWRARSRLGTALG